MAHSQWMSLWLVTVLVLNPGMANVISQTLLQPASIILAVDTTVDYNDAAHQACTASAIADCSLRGAISRANLRSRE